MTAHLTERQIESYKRLSSPQELIALDEHVAVCAECRERLAVVWDTRAALEGAEERARARSAEFSIEHLTYEQMESYVDGKMPEAAKTLAQAHAERCQECAQQLRDLEAFKLEREHVLSREKALAKKPASISFFSWAAIARVAAVLVVALGIGLALRWEIGRKPINRTKGPWPPSTQPIPVDQLSQDIAALQMQEQRVVREAIAQGKVTFPPELADLRPTQGTLRRPPAQSRRVSLLFPVGEVIDDPQPVFRWQSLPGAQSYKVDVLGRDPNSIQSGPPLRETQWKPQQPLQRGDVYRWQVTAIMKDGTQVLSPKLPMPEAKFRVLQNSQADEIRQFQLSHPNSHLVLGILYARVGILTAAAKELWQVSQNDANYGRAQALLKSIEKEQKAE